MGTTQNTDFSNTQGQITPRSEVRSGRNSNSSKMLLMSLLLPRIKKIRIKMVTDVLVTSKNKEDPNKNEGARVATTLNIDFSIKGR